MTLEIEALTVRYGTTVAVDDVSLTLPSGQVLALVGPSGCGKSTLLRAVAGLVEPDRGMITWDGADMTAVPTHQRDIGLMFQDHALFTHRSVADNIAFGLKMAGMASPRRRARVEELLELVGLEGFADRAIEGLSGGEAQRVALARALAPNPRLLLLDEPLASLDRARRIDLNAELGRLLRELEQTAVYVTHDQDEAFAVADTVGVMFDGRIERLAPPEQVWRDPQSEIVARFVGHETIIERQGVRYAVRPDAVSLAPAIGQKPIDADSHQSAQDLEQVRAVIVACAFQGDRFEIHAEADGVPWRFFHAAPIHVGSSVELAVDAARLARLDPPDSARG